MRALLQVTRPPCFHLFGRPANLLGRRCHLAKQVHDQLRLTARESDHLCFLASHTRKAPCTEEGSCSTRPRERLQGERGDPSW